MCAAVLLANVGLVALFAVGLAVVVAAIVFGLQLESKRRALLAGWARQRGFSFEEGRVSSLEQRFSGFDDFRTGDARYGFNVIRGSQNGRGVWAFDYHYQTYSQGKHGRQTHHHHFSAVILDTGLRLKPLSIRTEGFFDKVTAAIGFDDIDFESAEFSRTFHVKSPDRRWAYALLHQETMEYLLGAPRFKIKFDGPYVLARRSGRMKPPELEDAIGVVEGILDRVPRDIVAELGG